MNGNKPEWETPPLDASIAKQPMESCIRGPRLWWLVITAPMSSFFMIKPVEGIAEDLGISILYGFEKGVHWYCLCWFALTFFVQVGLGAFAFVMTERKFEWRRLLRVGVFTGIEGVLLCFVAFWMLLFLAFRSFSH
jgi:hypothetical protein